MSNTLSKKIYLELKVPTDEDSRSDQERILLALSYLGYENIEFPLNVLQKLYPLCRDCNYNITVSLVYKPTGWSIVNVEKDDQTKTHYGLAVDYGSTNIDVQLIDMNSGEIIRKVKEVNGQTTYGKDILTRITYTLEDPAHMDELQNVTVKSFENILDRLTAETEINTRECPVMVISGNTTMIHFLLKLNAWAVFASPYAPVTKDPGYIWGKDIGLNFDGMIYIVPAASNYVGGDIVSGLTTIDIHKNDKPSMFFDIGTNGELVIGNKDWLIAGAGAAGPALEGDISPFGMRAADGAVNTVKIDGADISYTTIGNAKPIGICASGIIDLIAQMRLNDWINIAGELNPDATPRVVYMQEAEQYVAVYATAEESGSGNALYFSQEDIKQYLDTKAAAYTMVECLMESAGLTPNDLQYCYLSGAIAANSDLESVITIGLLPDLERNKYVLVENTSLNGGRNILLDFTQLEETKYFSSEIYSMQFASIPDFLIRMQAAKFIPHTDMDRYPSIKDKLEGK